MNAHDLSPERAAWIDERFGLGPVRKRLKDTLTEAALAGPSRHHKRL
jgi:hypothetical protein